MSLSQTLPELPDAALADAADLVAYAAHPALAQLTAVLRAPLLPVIGFAELCAGEATPAERQAWAGEIVAASRSLLEVLDCTLALVAGRPTTTTDRPTLAAAATAVGALRCLLHLPPPGGRPAECHH